MNWITKKRLAKLLLQNATRGDVWQTGYDLSLKGSLPKYRSTRNIPLQEAVDIYYRRFKLAQAKNFNLAGFDNLIKALQTETEKNVRVHSFGVGERTCAVFTNPSTSRLIGIVITPASRL